MARIPEEEVERIKREIELAALVRSKSIELKKHGSKDLVGKCPFHNDETGSFVVSPRKNIFHCFGCGKTGSNIDFIMQYDGLSFRNACEILSGPEAAQLYKASAPIKKSTVPKLATPVAPGADDTAVMEQVADYYYERLMQNPDALDYLEKRGLRDDAMLKHFKIGFSDRTLGLRLPFKNRKTGEEIRSRLTQLGIYRESGHEHFPGCVVVPIRTGDTITEMYGRVIEKRKSKIKHLYLPGPHQGIFNEEALQNPEVILCESIFDALSFWKHDIRNVTAIYGTEGFTDELFDAMLKNNVRTVRLAYDADEAGDRAAKRDSERLMAHGIEVFRIRLPWETDVNDAVVELGKTYPGESLEPHLRRLIAGADWLGKTVASKPEIFFPEDPEDEPASSLVAEELVANEAPEVSQPQQLNDIAETASSLVAKELAAQPQGSTAKEKTALQQQGEHWFLTFDTREYRISGLEKCPGIESLKITLRIRVGEHFHSDQLDLCRDQERRRFVERAAEETNLKPELLKRDLGRVLMAIELHQEEKLRKERSGLDDSQSKIELSPKEETEALELLRAPDLIERITETFAKCGIIGEQTNILTAYLAGTSRKLDKPLAIIIQSTSAAGKSTLMEAVLSLFPQEEQVKYSAMTGQSLYYLGETNLKHKILAIVEEAGAEKASYALKLLQSEGELTIASTGKDPQTGRMITQEYHVEGPVMIILTTTSIEIDEELQNRCIVLTVDESMAQTARIHTQQRQRRTLEGLIAREERNDLLHILRNAQRLLQPINVLNPYAPSLTFEHKHTRARRDHEKYLTLIDSIALLHQHQRERHKRTINGREVEYIEVTIEDIEIANKIARETLARSLDELPPQTRRLFGHIKELALEIMQECGQPQNKAWFSRKELRDKCGWGETQVRIHLQRLEELEYIARRTGRQGVNCVYELLLPADQEDAPFILGLIDVDELRKKHGNDPTP